MSRSIRVIWDQLALFTERHRQFKWSRDNATVVTPIELVSGSDVIVRDVGLDDPLGFAAGQWVEIIDDDTELNGKPGQLLQIASVSTGRIKMQPAPATPPRAVDRALNPKLRRWDQVGTSLENGAAVTPLDTFQTLENGIQVSFSTGTYKTGDYWLIPARTATANIEWPSSPQPPRGIEHHFCRLALVQFDAGGLKVLEDCRQIFRRLTDLSTAPVRAMHVTGINWKNDDVQVFPTQFVFDPAGNAITNETLEITLDLPPDPISLTPATVIVTMEIPFLTATGIPPRLVALRLH